MPCESGVAVDILAEVPMRIVAPAGWSRHVRDASLEDLAHLPWVYTSESCPFHAMNRELFSDLDTEPDKVAYVDSEDAVRELIRAGAGLSILRADDAARMEASGDGVSWTGDTPGIELGFAVRQQRAGEPLVSTMQSLIAAMWLDSPEFAAGAEA